jgi:hypothetical protein
LIVFVKRARADIEASITRMTTNRGHRLILHAWLAREARAYHTEADDLLQHKLDNWQIQKTVIPDWLEIDYTSLAAHRFWRPPGERVDWPIMGTG